MRRVSSSSHANLASARNLGASKCLGGTLCECNLPMPSQLGLQVAKLLARAFVPNGRAFLGPDFTRLIDLADRSRFSSLKEFVGARKLILGERRDCCAIFSSSPDCCRWPPRLQRGFCFRWARSLAACVRRAKLSMAQYVRLASGKAAPSDQSKNLLIEGELAGWLAGLCGRSS